VIEFIIAFNVAYVEMEDNPEIGVLLEDEFEEVLTWPLDD
jgi:hypothetical protein